MEKSERITFRLSYPDAIALRDLCRRKGMTISQFVRSAVAGGVQDETGKSATVKEISVAYMVDAARKG